MATTRRVDLKEATSAYITTVVDNYIDNLAPNTEYVTRPTLMRGKVRREPLLAEHGLSFVIEVKADSEQHTIVMDFGISSVAMPHNLSALDIDITRAETFFISHGHHDHIGSVGPILGSLPEPVDVVVHPDALIGNRIHKFPDGKEIPIPTLRKEVIEKTGCPIVLVTSPKLLANGYVATLTDIPRQTDFEKGMPTAYYKEDDKLYKDDIRDDQGLVIHIKDKGLVVITGCGHAGIINTILYAKEVTGVEEIFAVIGGFHLTGTMLEPVIPPTVEAMKQFSPNVIVPCHCTGWKAIHEFEKAFPANFSLNSVGAVVQLY